MSINYAILGILSSKSVTGYEMKKIIQDSPFMYWSGNNNQIYKTLVELLDEGLVTNEVQHQDGSPSKKIYTITERGLEQLKQWMLSASEAPEFKKSFLIKLAWAGQLNADEMNTLLAGYENEIKMQIVMHEEMKHRKAFFPDKTPMDACLWGMIYENLISSYKNELDWIQKLRHELSINIKELNRMDYKVIEKNQKKYIEFASGKTPLRSEQDAVEMISLCYEYDTWLFMIHDAILPDDFFKLKTGLAGHILQKFANYRVKVAVILSDAQRIQGKFKELVAETNKGNDFRVFNSTDEAENWLLNQK